MMGAERVSGRPPARNIDAGTLLFMLAALIFLYGFLFVPPLVPIASSSGDSMVYVSDGLRMYRGEVIYRDFFQFSTPGTSLVYYVLFRIFGLRLWVPNVSILVLGLALAGLGVAIARKLMSPCVALLPSAIFLVGVYKSQLNPIHHWYSLLLVLAAVALLMDRRTLPTVAASGCLCGLATFFTQARGLAAAMGVAAFLWWEFESQQADRRCMLRQQACLAAGWVTALTAASAYFVWKAGFARFLWSTVVFGIRYHHRAGGENTFLGFVQDIPISGSPASLLPRFLQWAFVALIVPITYIWFFARYRRESNKRPALYWERPMLLAIVGVVLLLSVAPAPTLGRLGPSVLPGIILLVWLLDSGEKVGRVLAAAMTAGVLLIAPHAVAETQSGSRTIVKTPRGTMAVAAPEPSEKLEWLQQHTRPIEYFYSTDTSLYFYGNLRNPTPVPFVTDTGYTLPEQVEEVIRGLEQHRVQYILWDAGELGPVTKREEPAHDPLGILRRYILLHYHKLKVFSAGSEVWERNH